MRFIIKQGVKRPRHHIERLLLRGNVEVRLPAPISDIPLGGPIDLVQPPVVFNETQHRGLIRQPVINIVHLRPRCADARSRARAQLKNLVLIFRQISVASDRAKFDEATTQLAGFRASIASMAETLKAAQPWSLFDRDNHDAHFAAIRARRPDND